MPTESSPPYPDWRTSALPGIIPEPEAESAHKKQSIDRYAYWSGRKRFDRCDVCGRMETIQGEVRTLVDGVLVRCAAVGDCSKWMFEIEQLTEEQKDTLLAAAATGRAAPTFKHA